MPYIPHTPESLIGRSDSKDQATTCRGITSSGRLCRRSIGKSPRSQPSPSSTPGVDVHVDATTLFCWQHKDQVKRFGPRDQISRQQGQKIPAQRTSIDTLVDQLGILRVGTPDYSRNEPQGDPSSLENSKTNHDSSLQSRSKRERHRPVHPASRSPSRPQPKRKENRGLLALLCCFSAEYELDEDLRAPRIRPSESARQENLKSKEQSAQLSLNPASRPHPERDKHRVLHAPDPVAVDENSKVAFQAGHTSTRPASTIEVNRRHLPQAPVLQTETLLAMIPKSLSPQTASLLLSELAKPLSDTDGEGYIYIFCLTDRTMTDSSSATSINLDAPGQRVDQLLQDLSVRNSPTSRENQLLLKIGRATNVYRRMNQWTRQCGYDLSLVRWYPHVSSSSGPPTTPQKVRHVRRVERLIHLELADKQVKRRCTDCKQMHREWFSIDASLKGIRDMDRTVRRWVDWAGLT